MKNALTIDVEDWYQTMDFNFNVKRWGRFEDRVEYGMNHIMDALSKYNVKATFFVLGYIARKHPKLIRELSDNGHEIGSHGNFHRMVINQTEKEFRQDARFSKRLLEDITGREVSSFRASSWSISPDTLWALSILEEEGYKCDSSIQPFKTPLSGIKGAPKSPFHPIVDDVRLNLLEVPHTALGIGGGTLPFSGGLYLRALPMQFIKYALKKVNRNMPGMIYVHPWEMDSEQPRIKVPLHVKFTHYYNLKNNLNKFDELLKTFEFVPLKEITQSDIFPDLSPVGQRKYLFKNRRAKLAPKGY